MKSAKIALNYELSVNNVFIPNIGKSRGKTEKFSDNDTCYGFTVIFKRKNDSTKLYVDAEMPI